MPLASVVPGIHFYKRLIPWASVVTSIDCWKRLMPLALVVTSSLGFPPNLEFFLSRRDARFLERNDQELSATPAGSYTRYHSTFLQTFDAAGINGNKHWRLFIKVCLVNLFLPQNLQSPREPTPKFSTPLPFRVPEAASPNAPTPAPTKKPCHALHTAWHGPSFPEKTVKHPTYSVNYRRYFQRSSNATFFTLSSGTRSIR